MRHLSLAILPLLACHALAQLPAPSTILRAAPRATWTRVTSVLANAIPARADNPGAASPTKIYVFGGCAGNNTSTTLNDLWEFDGTTCTQLMANANPSAPHFRGRACVAWNFTSSKLVVFGGSNRATGPAAVDTLFNDTWEWDPVTNAWTNVTPATGNPTGRQLASMTWDPITGGMLMFGGQTSVTPALVSSETWLFIGGSWLLMTPANVPPARVQPKLVTRSDFGDVLLCGGQDDTFVASPDRLRHLDVWTWNGTNWTKISDWDWLTSTGTFPHSVGSCQAVYDPLRKRVVLQGGDGMTNGTTTNTIYIYGAAYGGSPSNWTSEFDCITNQWTIYSRKGADAAPLLALFGDSDAAIGRVSRFYAGYIASLGKIYKLCGQNPALTGSNPLYVFEYQANPVAAATSYGTGCTGSGGPLALTADNLPWTTRTFQATCTGLAAGSLAFGAIGFTAEATPLSALHPLGGIGCDLLATPTVSILMFPAAGSVTLSIGMPIDPAFAGTILRTQVIDIEIDVLFNITAITSSNALAITIGAI